MIDDIIRWLLLSIRRESLASILALTLRRSRPEEMAITPPNDANIMTKYMANEINNGPVKKLAPHEKPILNDYKRRPSWHSFMATFLSRMVLRAIICGTL